MGNNSTKNNSAAARPVARPVAPSYNIPQRSTNANIDFRATPSSNLQNRVSTTPSQYISHSTGNVSSAIRPSNTIGTSGSVRPVVVSTNQSNQSASSNVHNGVVKRTAPSIPPTTPTTIAYNSRNTVTYEVPKPAPRKSVSPANQTLDNANNAASSSNRSAISYESSLSRPSATVATTQRATAVPKEHIRARPTVQSVSRPLSHQFDTTATAAARTMFSSLNAQATPKDNSNNMNGSPYRPQQLQTSRSSSHLVEEITEATQNLKLSNTAHAVSPNDISNYMGTSNATNNNRRRRFQTNAQQNQSHKPNQQNADKKQNKNGKTFYNQNQQNNHSHGHNNRRRPKSMERTFSQASMETTGDQQPVSTERPETGTPRHQPRMNYFGFKKMEELLSKTAEDAIMALVHNKEGIANFIRDNELSPDLIALILEVLALVLCSSFHEIVGQVLQAMIQIEFFDKVRNFILEIPIATAQKRAHAKRFWSDPNKFFRNVAGVMDRFIETMPSNAMDIVPDMLTSIDYTLPNVQSRQNFTFAADIQELFDDLKIKKEQLEVKIAEKKEKQRARRDPNNYDDDGVGDDDQGPPPNDFREISVYPTAAEITTRAGTYLRKNIVKGAYTDVHHYLDVQFRLLREDFVAPLREGICEYLETRHDKNKPRLSTIKTYENVHCIGVVPNTNQCGYIVQAFKPGSIKNLEHSRRFMYGALVCLTSDNFRTIIFGKIICRDEKYLKEGQLVLGFDVGVELRLNLVYVFVECSVYFEPYYQVLTALKQLDERHFPFKEYLVDVRSESEEVDNLTKINESGYLRRDLRALNPSQQSAYVAAMSQRFCIVQGPPGTGKTYLGLKIAKTILLAGLYKAMGPMLVICYTNHALDQFLEGLLPVTKKLVRVGGQSKNETLAPYSLRQMAKNEKVPRDYMRSQWLAKEELDGCARQLGIEGSKLLLIDSYRGVVDFTTFEEYGVNLQFAWFQLATREEIAEWLLHQPAARLEPRFEDFERIKQQIREVKLPELQQQMDQEDGEEVHEIEDDDPNVVQMKENQLDVDDDDELLKIDYSSGKNSVIVDTDHMRGEIMTCQHELRRMQDMQLDNTIEYLQLVQKLIKLTIDYDYVCEQLHTIGNLKRVPYVNVRGYTHPNMVPAKERWLLYASWLRQIREIVLERYVEIDRTYRQLYTKYNEVRDMIDLYKLKSMEVVGMTTTGAARLHKTLLALQCPIVIVEEAAEVLEAHIVTALSPHCKQLLLIGDHKQLKPTTADYDMDKKYRLGVSLFERMVVNGLHCHTLNVQHRMRPEIANLVCPSIYPELINHESVTLYPQVRGVDAPLYFITHEVREKESSDRSKENEFEAEYLIQLARYLVLNNYDASRITIIAAYSGQWFLMRRLKMKHHILTNVRICVLDNFQGEENDIILLSLVRNNEKGQNGFLNLENRICVALSRAKHGMYIMGNIHQLSAKNTTWQQVHEVLKKYDAIGTYLTVRCVNHPECVAHLGQISDFQRVPEGGCRKTCGKSLDCGHTCTKMCHSTSHESYKCNQPCNKVICPQGHVCPDKCFMECGQCMVPKFARLPCGHEMDIPCHQSPEDINCPVELTTTLPCGHVTEKPCHKATETFPCPHPCETRVEPCGHACELRCHIRKDPHHEKYKCMKPCAKSNDKCTLSEGEQHPCVKRCFEKCDDCAVVRKKERNCGHFFNVPCHVNVDEAIECKKPCPRQLSCGHKCKSTCDKVCPPCKVKVMKPIPECGHQVKYECSETPPRKLCNYPICKRTLQCGHSCNLPCGRNCDDAQCMELIVYPKRSPCGHVLYVPCHLSDAPTITDELLSYCTAKCEAKLACEHDCPGTCGQCAQGRFHAACTAKCSKILICGHECATPCAENCRPCTQRCEYRCEHSKCVKECGAPCTSCTEDCNRRCAHQICRVKCGQICKVPPCNEPCDEVLPCGHPCIGFCGDPCPPLCRICNADEVTEIFFGNEDEEDARFVYLEECHHTLESSGLDHYFGMMTEEQAQEQGTKEIQMPRCPKCKTPAMVPRYRDHIKRAYQDVQHIKAELFGHPKELKELSKALKEDIEKLPTAAKDYKSVLEYFKEQLRITSKKNPQRKDNSKAKLISLRARYDMFMQMVTLRHPVPIEIPLTPNAKALVDPYMQFLLGRLMAADAMIKDAQVEEFRRELMRLHRMMQLAQIHATNANCVTFLEYTICRDRLFNHHEYKLKADAEVCHALKQLGRKANSGLAITDVERREIVAAVGMSKGHWFKCANGHFYVIGACGGAMQVARCPECGLQIGGERHRLLDDNRLAPEMDGARAPAFPTLNDINMYRL